MTSATHTYTAHHVALKETARCHRPLHPFDVRVLVAIHERGGEASIAQLAEDLADAEGAAVRRCRFRLCMHGFAEMADWPTDSTISTNAAGEAVVRTFFSQLRCAAVERPAPEPCEAFRLGTTVGGAAFCRTCGHARGNHAQEREVAGV